MFYKLPPDCEISFTGSALLLPAFKKLGSKTSMQHLHFVPFLRRPVIQCVFSGSLFVLDSRFVLRALSFMPTFIF